MRIIWPVIFTTLLPYLGNAQDFGGVDLADALSAASEAQLGSLGDVKASKRPKRKTTPRATAATTPAAVAVAAAVPAAKALSAPAPADNHIVRTSPGDESGFRRAPPKGSAAASNTGFPSQPGREPRPLLDSISPAALTPGQVATLGGSTGAGTGGPGGAAGAAAGTAGGAGGTPGGAAPPGGVPPGGGAQAGMGAGGAATAKPPPATTFSGYLVGSPYPFVLPPPDIPYFGSKWNGPWGYPVGHYQAFRGTGQYITHYSYYPLSYFGSLMAPFAYGVSGKR